MSRSDDVINQCSPPTAHAEGFNARRASIRAGEVGAAQISLDNDPAVGFDDGSKWVFGDYKSDIQYI